jgi:1-acyl-sn-glycerol-3-phosphate acyltransferase
MRFLCSLIFNLYIYFVTIVLGLIFLPALFFPNRRGAIHGIKIWSSCILKALWTLCRVKVEIRGLEHLPKEPALIACKHHSVWETIIFFTLIEDPAYVLRREVLLYPIAGWYVAKAALVPVDRKGGAKALRSMVNKACKRLAQGRSILIFPEGARCTPGAPPDYKPGVAALYRRLDQPCIPAALNSGLFWPRRTILKHPGTIVLEFLPAIPPGLARKPFMNELQTRIETASDRLLQEGKNQQQALKQGQA